MKDMFLFTVRICAGFTLTLCVITLALTEKQEIKNHDDDPHEVW